jgi:DNA-binding MarR family transcriptional regulator
VAKSRPAVTSRPAGQARAIGQDGVVDALVQAAFMTMAVLNKVGADNDLSLTQLRVLAILRDRRLRMTALADYLGLEKSTMTGLVDRAEKKGLLERAANAGDGRAVDVFLSPGGAELAERLYAQVGRALSPMTSELDPGRQRQLQELLERMLGPHESASEGRRRKGY